MTSPAELSVTDLSPCMTCGGSLHTTEQCSMNDEMPTCIWCRKDGHWSMNCKATLDPVPEARRKLNALRDDVAGGYHERDPLLTTLDEILWLMGEGDV